MERNIRIRQTSSGEIPKQGFQIVDLRDYEEGAYLTDSDPYNEIYDLLIEELLYKYNLDMAA
jgi:hypothetical protein